MKPSAFAYHAPKALPEALDLLARYGGDCKILAGGQSLVPTMNFRLAKPSILIDVNEVPGLAFVSDADGQLRIGAMTRHAAFHRPIVHGPLGAMLATVARHIAHYPIRQRGTFGGSLAHADPASEWCLVTVTLGGDIVTLSAKGRRCLPADDFFHGALTTDLDDAELLTEVLLPRLEGWTFGFHEVSRRAGDFALAAAFVGLYVQGGAIADARIGVCGIADRAVRLRSIEAALIGERPDTLSLASVAANGPTDAALAESVCTNSAYRSDLLVAVLERALTKAMSGEHTGKTI